MPEMHWLRRWGPAMLGAAAIWLLSTEIFSDINTGRVIYPVLSWLFPHMPARTMLYCHKAIRKLAHVTVYFFFSLILLHSIRGERKGWQWRWALFAVGTAFGYAILDEIHQSFVPLRHAAVRDVLLDTGGALMAQVLVWWRYRGLDRN